MSLIRFVLQHCFARPFFLFLQVCYLWQPVQLHGLLSLSFRAFGYFSFVMLESAVYWPPFCCTCTAWTFSCNLDPVPVLEECCKFHAYRTI